MNNEMTGLRERIAVRSARLSEITVEIKAELYGIDDIIDRVIESVRAWYILPELITRPVIVCLWGLTGTGKTQLTRTLARKLGFFETALSKSRWMDFQTANRGCATPLCHLRTPTNGS